MRRCQKCKFQEIYDISPRKDGEMGGKAKIYSFWNRQPSLRLRVQLLLSLADMSRLACAVVPAGVVGIVAILFSRCYRGKGRGGWFRGFLSCWWGCLAWASWDLLEPADMTVQPNRCATACDPSQKTISYSWSSMKAVQEAPPQKQTISHHAIQLQMILELYSVHQQY